MPIPQDYELNNFLQKLADEVTEEDLRKLKALLHGDGGLQRRTSASIESAVDYFTVLKERLYLNRENLIFLQACLWNIGRRDLHRKCVEFAKSSEKILHFYCPKETPENGYQFIKFHVAGGLDTFQRLQLEHVRRTVAQLMGCLAEHVFVAGIEPSNSLVVTLMVLASYVDLLPCADKHELVLLRAVDVDKIIIKETVEIEIPCYGGYHASEIRNILRRMKDLERQLDSTQQALLEAEKERRKLFQSSMARKPPNSPIVPGTRDLSFLSSTPTKSPGTQTARVAFVVGSDTEEQTKEETTVLYASQMSIEKGSDMEQEGYTHSIKVSNLPPDAVDEELREYFERRREHGGGPVKDVTLTSQSGEAIVSFQDPGTVTRLLQSEPLLFKTHYIKVEPYVPMDDSRLSLSGLAEPQPTSEAEQSLTVTLEVSGFKPETREETLEDYFENEKSGGRAESVCLPVRVEADKSVAYVKLRDRNVAKNVLKKKDHILDGVKLEVKMCDQRDVEPKFYKNKVFVTGIDPKTTQDGLENYLSNRANARVCDTVRGEDESKAVVTFASDIYIKKLQEMCRTKTLDGNNLTVENVKVNGSVLVRNVLDTTTEDCLGMHFQYRVNGGKIRKIQKQGEDSFLVWFSNATVAGDVCSRYHSVDGQELEVSLYYECLGVSRNSQLEMTFDTPHDFAFDPRDMNKLSYLASSPQAKNKLKSQLEPLYATADIQTEGKFKNISLHCTLAYDVPECRQKSRKWMKKVTKKMEEFFHSIVVETLNPLKEVWAEVEQKKEEFEKEAEGSVIIVPNFDSLEVRVIGWKEDVSIVMEKLRSFIKKANEKLEKIKNEITEVFSISKPLSIKVLKEVGFIEKCLKDFPRCQVNITEDKLKVEFVGFPTDVYRAKCAMLELLHGRSRVPVGPFSKHRLEFLESPKIFGYLAEKMKEKGLKGFYEIRKDRYIEVNAETDEKAVNTAQFIKSFIIETPRKVTSFDKPLLRSSKFKSEVEKIQSDYSGLVKVIPDAENLVIRTLVVSEVEKIVLELIDKFLNENIMVGEALRIPSAMSRYIKMFCLDDLENIESRFKENYHVQIYCIPSAVCVTAVEAGLSEVEREVMNMIQKIVRITETMKRPSVVKYLKSESSTSKADYIEQEFQCVITADTEEVFNMPIQTQNSRENDMYQMASCEMNYGRKVVVVKHDLTDMDVDVIVNAADNRLKLEGGLALVIGQKGGDKMRKVCHDFIQEKGPLSYGEIFCCTASGSLKCGAVIHAVGPVWQDGSHQEAELLREVILSSLEECDKPGNQFHSVAIPAISTGVFNYPREKATQVIVETIRDYFLEHQDSVIQEVHLCDIKTLVVEAFTAALKNTFKNVVEGESSGRAWKRLKQPAEKTSFEMEYTFGNSLDKREPTESSVELTFYGHNIDQLQSAYQNFLDKADKDDYVRKDNNDPMLKDLKEKQKTKLYNKAKELGVHLDFGKLRVGRIKLHGLKEDVYEMEEAIQKLLRKHSTQQKEERERDYFQAVVKWRMVYDDGQEVECTPQLNMKLEEYFRQQERRIHFSMGDEQLTADFSKMTLYDCYRTCKLDRISKTEGKMTTALPSNWSPMSEEDNLITIPLSKNKQEYINVLSKLKSESQDKININWPSVVVERVQNQTLFRQYVARKESMENQPQASSAPVERELWHTVDIDATFIINSEGFNRNICNRKSKSLGQGVYFDVSLVHSLEETDLQTKGRQRIVYLCRVLTGTFTKGSPSLIVPPENKSGGSILQCYDSVVDDTDSPQTFVIFRDSQAYPKYMIKFSLS
ncbi:protein mono-ADP-ribosyltransferase PARP14-like [Saccostrea echinata]|uniref:protein mono-ADP-ribosyltransferase PARP14-like n=1 Tax=Saccostrea echinata TaxID=191078 RepID=UPI002A7FC2ED|nr:protein mono-ADP-ribosyltransferase PARP14-like [Saccostrea echinata]